MKKIKILLITFIIIGSSFTSLLGFAKQTEPTYTTTNLLNSFVLPGTISSTDADYLGISENTNSATISDINTQFLIVKVFNTYCIRCIEKFPALSTLFSQIQHSTLNNSIKVIGVCMSNTQEEVDQCRSKYSVPFPLLADNENSIYKYVGRVSIPHYVILERNNLGQFVPVSIAENKAKNVLAFFDIIQERTKLTKDMK